MELGDHNLHPSCRFRPGKDQPARREHGRSALGPKSTEFVWEAARLSTPVARTAAGKATTSTPASPLLIFVSIALLLASLRLHCSSRVYGSDRPGFGSSPEISMLKAAVLLRSLLVLLRLLVLRGSAVGLSICGGRQHERADAEDERCHDGELDLGHLSSPCFEPFAQGDRTMLKDNPLVTKLCTFFETSSRHNMLYVLGFGLVGAILAHAIHSRAFQFFLIAS